MDQREAIRTVRRYGQLVSEHLPFDKLYLFGSYATNSAREDSDLDVAIIVKRIDGDFFDLHPLLWRLRREIDDRIEPILLESDNDPADFIGSIKRKGLEVKLFA